MEDNRPTLDPQINEELKRILSKEDNELTANDKAFLRARKPYIGKESRTRLSWVFAEEPEPITPENPTYPSGKEDVNSPHNEHPADKEAREAAEKVELEEKKQPEQPKKDGKPATNDAEDDIEEDELEDDAELEEEEK